MNKYLILGAYAPTDGSAASYMKVDELDSFLACIRLLTALVSDKENCYDFYLIIHDGVVLLDAQDWMLRE